MTLGRALTADGIFATQVGPDFAAGTSSLLRNSWGHTSPSPFDTVSLPEVGISEQEGRFIVTFKEMTEIRPAKWLNTTIGKMIQLLLLPKDWNSDAPNRIEPKAVERILETLIVMLDSDSTPPIVVPTTRGGIQVEWHQNGIDLEIEALNSGKLELFFSGPGGEQEEVIEGDSLSLKRFTRYLKAPRRPR